MLDKMSRIHLRNQPYSNQLTQLVREMRNISATQEELQETIKIMAMNRRATITTDDIYNLVVSSSLVGGFVLVVFLSVMTWA
jgi:hypothetical protein